MSGLMPSVIENTIVKARASSVAGITNYYDSVNKIKVVIGESGQVITIIPGRG